MTWNVSKRKREVWTRKRSLFLFLTVTQRLYVYWDVNTLRGIGFWSEPPEGEPEFVSLERLYNGGWQREAF